MIGSVVKCCVISGQELESFLSKIEDIFVNLNCHKCDNFQLKRTETGTGDTGETGPVKDVSYGVPLHEGKKALIIEFDVISNISSDEVPAFKDR